MHITWGLSSMYDGAGRGGGEGGLDNICSIYVCGVSSVWNGILPFICQYAADEVVKKCKRQTRR